MWELNSNTFPNYAGIFTVHKEQMMSHLPPQPGQSYHSLDGRLKMVIQPQSQRLHVGENLQLECGAMGRPIPRYQWHRNGVPVPNATKRKLLVRKLLFKRFNDVTCTSFCLLFGKYCLHSYGYEPLWDISVYFYSTRECLLKILHLEQGICNGKLLCIMHYRFPRRCTIITADIAVRSAAALRECGPMKLML